MVHQQIGQTAGLLGFHVNVCVRNCNTISRKGLRAMIFSTAQNAGE